MSNTLILPATNFTSSPNTPTVSNPAESALAKAAVEPAVGPAVEPVVAQVVGLGGADSTRKSPWLTILLSAAAGALLTYYVTTKMAK
jgi:hypothetical protein